MVDGVGSGDRESWGGILELPLTGCVTFDKGLQPSEPCILWNGAVRPASQGCCQD